MLRPRSPVSIVLFAVYLCAGLVALSLWSVSQFPEFGISFHRGAIRGNIVVLDSDGHRLAGIPANEPVVFWQNGQAVGLSAEQLLPTHVPGPSLASDRRWYEAASALTRMAGRGSVTVQLVTGGPLIQLKPAHRNLAHLEAEFWVILAIGVYSMIIGAWVWALRPRDWGARTYALTAACFSICSFAAGVYGAREAVAGGVTLWGLSALNYVFSQVGLWLMAAMFMNFPRTVVRPRFWHLIFPLIVIGGAAAGTAFLDVKLVFRSMLIPLVLIMIFVGAQWRQSRNDPVARTVLRWMGLTVLLGLGIGASFMVLPRLTGGPPVTANSFALFPSLISFGGVAVGVGRYRLFDLDRWAYRIILVAAAALALMAADGALIFFLRFEPPAALGISLLVIALAYLPLRGALWRMMDGKVAPIDSRLFQSAAQVAFTPGLSARQEAWRAMLTELYDPLEIEVAGDDVQVAKRRADGLELAIPATAGETALILRYPGKGRRLFNAEHVALARELIAFMNKAEAARDSYRRGVMEERGRIAQDLHDDVGARLLTSLHRPDVEQVRADVRSAMDDIRVIVGGMSGEHIPASRMLADLRGEAATRLEDAGLTLDWPPVEAAAPDRNLDFWIYKNVRSAHREVVSNVLRHAKARHVKASARIDDEVLHLTVEDDGVGLAPRQAGARDGNGMRNTRRRLEQLGGVLTVTDAEPGLRVEIMVPLTPRG